VKLLVIKLSALGDVVQTLPCISLLKKELPEAEIHWVVDERNAPLLKGHPQIEKLFIFSNRFFKNPVKFYSFVKKLRQEEYEAVIDYQGLFKSGILAFFSKAGLKAGFARAREGSPLFYSLKVDVSFEVHAVRRYLLLTEAVLKDFGAKAEFNSIPQAELPFEEYPLPEEPFVVIVPEARWSTKLWPLSFWEKIIQESFLRKKGFKFFILASGKNREIRSWAEGLSRREEGVVSLVGRLSLPQVVWVIKKAGLVLTVDTGPMHIASALDVPTVALFGPTSPERTGPWGKHFKVVKSPLPCSPCFKKKCEREGECMKAISPSQVISAVEELFNKLLPSALPFSPASPPFPQ